ncbi:MAG: hypothetical protein R2838_09375 [Caldilineaceae bacterium]
MNSSRPSPNTCRFCAHHRRQCGAGHRRRCGHRDPAHRPVDDAAQRKPANGGMVRYVLFESGIYPDVAQLASRHSIGRALPLLVELFEQYERQGILRRDRHVRAQALLGMLLAQVLFRPALTSLPALDDAATAHFRSYPPARHHGTTSK